MPGGDRTGPAGFGRMTGRAAGYCAGYSVPGYMNPIPGRLAWGYGLPIAYQEAYSRPFFYAQSAALPYGSYPRSGWGRGWGRGRGRYWGRGRGFGPELGFW